MLGLRVAARTIDEDLDHEEFRGARAGSDRLAGPDRDRERGSPSGRQAAQHTGISTPIQYPSKHCFRGISRARSDRVVQPTEKERNLHPAGAGIGAGVGAGVVATTKSDGLAAAAGFLYGIPIGAVVGVVTAGYRRCELIYSAN